jgi:hypothetical protein
MKTKVVDNQPDSAPHKNYYAQVTRIMSMDDRIKLWHFKVFTFVMSYWNPYYGYAFPNRGQVMKGLGQKWWGNIQRYIDDLERWGYLKTKLVDYDDTRKIVYFYGLVSPDQDLVTGDQNLVTPPDSSIINSTLKDYNT